MNNIMIIKVESEQGKRKADGYREKERKRELETETDIWMWRDLTMERKT